MPSPRASSPAPPAANPLPRAHAPHPPLHAQAGAAAGLGQGALAGDHQNLRSLLKVVGPTLYGTLFGIGCRAGVPALPFAFASGVSLVAVALVAISPVAAWETLSPKENKAGIDPPAGAPVDAGVAGAGPGPTSSAQQPQRKPAS